MAQSAAANRVYQDFEPFFEWSEDEASATLVVMLPGIFITFFSSNPFEFFRFQNPLTLSLKSKHYTLLHSCTNTFS